MSGATSSDDLGVYVHVPFCEHVCPYCDFAVKGVGRLQVSEEQRYVEGLLRELELTCAELPALRGRPLATVYFGGGTPSLLSAASVERVLGRLREVFAGEPDEVTLELNPSRLESRRVPEFRAAGVTRLSVGLQSLQDRVLQRLGRAQRSVEARSALETCLRAGFRSLSVDLIYGAPDQRTDDLLGDLDWVIGRGVAHVSAYALTLEPGTPFARAHLRGRLALPSEETVVDMSRRLRTRLARAGYRQYEISSFARPGHASVHNQRYWQRRDVLGIGVSAASKIEQTRFQNLRSLGLWRERLTADKRPVDERETISEAAARREALYLGLRRLEGVSCAAYRRSFGAPPDAHFATELEELRELDLVVEDAGWLRLTERGILFADEVFLRFVGR